MGQDEVRVGFVGAGAIVRDRHVPGLSKIAGVRFVGVVNRSRASGERAAEEFGIERVYPSWDELVCSDEIDSVVIGTWPYMHCPVTLAALRAGKHVFCQARMCMDYAEASKMLAAAERADRVTMLCPPPMGMAGDYWMKELLASGFIGEPRSIHLRAMASNLVDPSAPFHWRLNRSLSGYNTLTVGIYAEVIHRWFGFASRVTAVTETFTKKRPRPDGSGSVQVRVPDAVFVSVEMESGALAAMQWSGAAPFPEPSILEVHGSSGSLRYLLERDEIFGAGLADKELKPLPIPPEKMRHWTVEEDFIAAIRDGTPVSPSFHDGLKYMEFTEAVIRSGEEQRSISLPLPSPGAI